MDEEWDGSVAIGAMATLPADHLPSVATRLDPAAWVLTSELLYDGTYVSIPWPYSGWSKVTENLMKLIIS